MNKHTNKALISSVIALVLCCAMLVGSTFAWFTDSVKTGINKIEAGTLDIVLEMKDENGNWVDAEGQSLNFTNNMWEPGCTYNLPALRIRNNGSLALKYTVVINGVTVGSDQKLLEVIDFTVDGVDIHNWNGKLTAGQTSNEFVLSATMDKEAGNEYQELSLKGLGITVLATQLNYEEDITGPDYDEDAAWPLHADIDWYLEDPDASEFVLDNAFELAGLAALVNGTAKNPVVTYAANAQTTIQDSFKGKTIKLSADIDLDNRLWAPIGNSSHGFWGTFDGNGHTVSNLWVKEDTNAGLFGYALNGGNVKNLNVENALIQAHDYAGAIMGRGYTDIDNCHVKNVTVITTPYLKNGVYDGGTKAGGVIGQLLEGSGNTVTNCSATDVKIYAFRDLGGVVGMIHNNNSASGNTASNVTLGYILCDQITADENENAGAIYGRVQSSATVSPAKDSAENQDFTLVYAVHDVVSLTSLSNMVAKGNTFKDQTVVLLDDVDLGGEEWSPIGTVVDGKSTDFSYAFRGTFDGQNHTVSNLKVNNLGWAGLFGLAYKAVIKNVSVKGAAISSSRMTGAIVGQLYGSLDNCHVSDAVITVVPNEISEGKFDNGDKVGGIVGWIGDNGNGNYVTNCSATNVSVKAYRDVGGIAGYVAYSSTVADNTVTNAVITVDQTTNSYGKKDYNAGAIWGRNSVGKNGEGVTAENNAEVGVEIKLPMPEGMPVATVVTVDEYVGKTQNWNAAFGEVDPEQTLDVAYQFSAPHDSSNIDECEFKDWHCDYYVSIDRDIEAGVIFLGGNYGSFGWVGFTNPEAVEANVEVPLLGSVVTNAWTYEQIASFVGEFLCGVGRAEGTDDEILRGATFTVELRLTNPNDPDEFYAVSTVSYTFE